MKMKHIVASFALLGAMTASIAFALPQNAETKVEKPVPQEGTFAALTEEQMAEWMRMHDALIAKVEPLKLVLKARKMELKALKNNVKVTPDYLRDLTEEIVNLDARIDTLNENFSEESAEKFNLNFAKMGFGMGGKAKSGCPAMGGAMMRGHGMQGGHPCVIMNGHPVPRGHVSPCPVMRGNK